MSYRHILLALDLSEDSEAVARRGLEIARPLQAEVSLLHVVEFIPVDPAGEALLPPPVDMESELVEGARRRLAELADRLGLERAPQHVEVGNIKAEIVRVAQEQDADLVVLGSRERHGLAILLGSTEKSILSSAPCDVLAVRLS